MVGSISVRPHVGEPLALDLMNTEWVADGQEVDYLDEPANVGVWLAENGITADVTPALRAALVEARAAIRGVLVDGDDAARQRLNAVLAKGAIRLVLGDSDRARRIVATDEPAWRPAVLAAVDLVELRESAPGRIRQCEHPNCVLWFLDTSRNGNRRWHSMTTCGNRAKAQRHYARRRGVS